MDQQGASGHSGTAALSFLRYWKITEMQLWDQAYVNLLVEGFIEFDEADGEHITGCFQFGTVRAGCMLTCERSATSLSSSGHGKAITTTTLVADADGRRLSAMN
jgi:hypothetical protein